MFTKKLKVMLVSTMFVSAVSLASNWHLVSESSLSKKITKKIINKEQDILKLMKDKYGYAMDVPLVITDKLEKNVYGMTVCDEDGSIRIFLNKEIINNNIDYVLETVLPHEYAHVLMFKEKLLNNAKKNYALEIQQAGLPSTYDGHNKTWKNICKNLGGLKCERFVSRKDAYISKVF